MNNTMSETVNFEILNLRIPEQVKTYPLEKQQEILEYLQSMNDTHKKAYLIAFDHLGSSFNIYKSNGFKEWKQKSL
jgi:predicted deacetylase